MTPIEEQIANLLPSVKVRAESERFSETRPHSLSGKSIEKSRQVLGVGTISLLNADGNLEKCLEYLTKSVAASPIGSEELALAYSIRAGILFQLGKFPYALLDINRALMAAGPSFLELIKEEWLRLKMVYWRKVQRDNDVRLNTKNPMEGAQRLWRTELATGGDLNMTEKILFCTDMMSIDQTDLVINYALFDDDLWNTKLDNALLPNVSSKVKLEWNSTWGLHLVATDDIAPGEVLLVQEYFAVKLLESWSTEYCAYCTTWCQALIPCHTCSEEMYCNVICREKAHDSYHRTECKLVPFLNLLDIDEHEKTKIRMALRAFLTGTKQGWDLVNLMNDPRVREMIRGKENFTGQPLGSDDYESILNTPWKYPKNWMNKNSTCTQLHALDCIFYALWSIDFFREFENAEQSEGLTELELFAGSILLQNLCVGQQSGHPMFTTIVDSVDRGMEITKIGYGVGTLRNFMIQSCIPNTMTITDKGRLLAYCLKPIKAGEQIFTANDIADYLLEASKDKRQSYLESISKECECRACVEVWPSHSDLLNKNEQYLPIDDVRASLLAMTGLIGSASYLHEIFEFNREYREYVEEPSQTLFLCDDLIHRTMLAKGNTYYAGSTNRFIP